jgi:hypothetical protein
MQVRNGIGREHPFPQDVLMHVIETHCHTAIFVNKLETTLESTLKSLRVHPLKDCLLYLPHR